MEQRPFHTLPWVWYRGPFHRYGTVHVPGMACVRKTGGLILHDRTIPVPYPFHTSESDFQRIPHPRVWYRGPFHRYGTRVRSIVWNRHRSIPFTRYGTRARSIVWNQTFSNGPPWSQRKNAQPYDAFSLVSLSEINVHPLDSVT